VALFEISYHRGCFTQVLIIPNPQIHTRTSKVPNSRLSHQSDNKARIRFGNVSSLQVWRLSSVYFLLVMTSGPIWLDVYHRYS
jgi:hypothetical protein